MKPARLKLNVVANLAGGAWMSALSLICVPLYLRYLGIEAYGLIGFFAMLTAVLALMDAGLGTAVNRGLARLSVREDTIDRQRDLLRTLEIVYWSASLVVGAALIVLAPFIASRWIHAQHLPPGTVENAVRLMGIVFALQFPFALYQNSLIGLQRQVLVNVIMIVTGTLRSVGAVAVLMFVSPTVEAFFLWQAGVTVLQTAAIAISAWRIVAGPSAPRFRRSILRDEWTYASSVAASAILGVILTQCDKLLLSGLLTLEQFGYYALAGTVAAALWWLIVPVSSALFPRFVQLIELGDHRALVDLYHGASQIMAILVLPAGATLALFARPIIAIWTRNSAAADGAAPIVALLVAGTCLNALAVLPAAVQSAAGWPQLMMYTNACEAVLLIPGVIFMATHYGPRGAASIWVVMNLIYITVTAPIMHRRLLRGEFWRWLSRDVAIPLLTVIAAGVLIRVFVPLPSSRLMTLLCIGAAFAGIALAAILAAPRGRTILLDTVRSGRRHPLLPWNAGGVS